MVTGQLKTCKAYYFGDWSKRVSFAKTDWPILTIYTSYDVFFFAQKKLPFGVAMIASALKILPALFFNRD